MGILQLLGVKGPSSRTRSRKPLRRLRFEGLEQRRLLTGAGEANLLIGVEAAGPVEEFVEVAGPNGGDEVFNGGGGAPNGGGGGQQQDEPRLDGHVDPLTDAERQKLEGRQDRRSQQILRDLDKAEDDARRAQAAADAKSEAIDLIKTELAEAEGRLQAVSTEIEQIDDRIAELNEVVERSDENRRRITNEQLDDHNQIMVQNPDGSIGVTQHSISGDLDRVNDRQQDAVKEIESLTARRAELVAEKAGLEASVKTIKERLAAAEAETNNALSDPVPFWQHVYRLRAQARRIAGREPVAPPQQGPVIGDTLAVSTIVGTYRRPFGKGIRNVLPWITTFIDEVQISSIGRAWQRHQITRIATYTYRGEGLWELSDIKFQDSALEDKGGFASGDEAVREVLADQQRINRQIHESRINTPSTLPNSNR